MMIATESVVVKKLKIKFSGRKSEAEVGPQLCAKPASFLEDWNHGAVSDEMNKICGSKVLSSKREIHSDEHHLKVKFSTSGSRKRAFSPDPDLEDSQKRQKVDRAVMQQCLTILKRLMQHQCGWPFNQPVDPVALNIPDYFSIITEPMDLGTIKLKLESNKYLVTEGFATDVRLTFSNAMRYNPPGNQVHIMASKLSKIFETGWKALEAKWLRGTVKAQHGEQANRINKTVNSQSGPRTPPKNTALPKNREHSKEKGKSINDPRIVKASVTKLPEKSVSKPLEENKKGIENDQTGTCQSKCDSCGNLTCGCSIASELSHVSSSEIPSEMSASGGHSCTSDASRLTKSMSGSQTSKSDPNSEGAVSAIDDGNVCPSSKFETPAMDDTNREGWSTPLLEVQLSPKRALRAAMLKSRFADTILKAQQKALIDHSDKADPVRLQQEKERLERRQREEKARIEAQIKAAKAAEQIRAEAEMRQQRERDREAARLALQQMERTVVIGENLEIFKELEMLSGCSLSPRLPEGDDCSEVVSGSFEGNPLQQLGLFMKDDYLDYDDEEMVLNGEEGEILL